MQPLLNIGMRAARRAGDLIVRSLSRLDSLKIDSKGGTTSSRTSTARRGRHHRHDPPQPPPSRLSRRGERPQRRRRIRLDIDPLDGTTNFLTASRRSRFRSRSSTRAACSTPSSTIHAPEFFTASRGDGAQLEGKKIRVSTQRTLEGSLIGTVSRSAAAIMSMNTCDAESRHVHGRRRAPPGCGLAGSRLCRRGTNRRLLGIRPVALGHRGRHTSDPGSRRARRHSTGSEYALGPNIIAGNPKVYQALLDAVDR